MCFGHVVPNICRSYLAKIRVKRCNGFLVREESQNCIILVQEQTVAKISPNLRRVWHGASWSFTVHLHFEECEPFREHGLSVGNCASGLEMAHNPGNGGAPGKITRFHATVAAESTELLLLFLFPQTKIRQFWLFPLVRKLLQRLTWIFVK